jgi:hypothetical protein
VLAASLAGNTLIVEGASLVLAEWRDPGGATDPPRYIAPLQSITPTTRRGTSRRARSTLISWPNG